MERSRMAVISLPVVTLDIVQAVRVNDGFFSSFLIASKKSREKVAIVWNFVRRRSHLPLSLTLLGSCHYKADNRIWLGSTQTLYYRIVGLYQIQPWHLRDLPELEPREVQNDRVVGSLSKHDGRVFLSSDVEVEEENNSRRFFYWDGWLSGEAAVKYF